jgi:hypothetical protein
VGVGFGIDILANIAEGKPKIPKLAPIDAQTEQTKAIAGNAASLPALMEQGGKINEFTANEINRMAEILSPGYGALRDRVMGAFNDQISGNIPRDVSLQVQRNSAVKSLYGGFSGTGMAKNLTARDLGLTSMDITQKGLDSAQRWMLAVRSGTPQFDVTSMFVSPALQIQTSFAEREAQFQRNYISNLNDWEHSIGHAIGEDIRATGQFFTSILSSYMGGGMTGGGAPSGGGSSSGMSQQQASNFWSEFNGTGN